MKTGLKKPLAFKRKEWKDYAFSYAYIAPFLLVFVLFTILPVAIAIFYSFTNYNVLEPPRFIFLNNYFKLFLEDEEFLIAIKNTLIIAVVTGPVGYMMSLLFAWIINELRPLLRTIMVIVFYAPSISGGVYRIWTIMFSGDSYGYANSVLLYMGVIDSPIQWLTDPKYMLPLVIIVMLWMSLGTGFLSFVAGLQTIDKTYYEVGYVEGIRNRWQELWFITLPSMKPQLMFGAVMSITSSFAVGDVTSSLCGFPSTDYAAHTVVNHLQDYGSIRFDMGYACAIATILFVMMVGTNKFIQKILANVGQ